MYVVITNATMKDIIFLSHNLRKNKYIKKKVQDRELLI